ncbi:MAG: PQQ-binding-like beta-propeller repeat protein [Gammaproteobacteria bacterium]|nr:PQQ-binding-like beta-propeller repeat protein [Gammaproteobacteria bacterium]
MSKIFIVSLLLLVQSAFADLLRTGNGERNYQQHCATCHNSGIQQVPVFADLQTMLPATIMQSLTRGRMGFIGNKLTGMERIAVIEYISQKKYIAQDSGTAMRQYTGFCEIYPAFLPDFDNRPHWNGWGVDLANKRYQPSAMAGISVAEVPHLKLDWAFAFPGETRTVGQPTVVGGRIFVGTYTGKVYSLDAKSGCLYWVFDTNDSVRTAITINNVGNFGKAKYAAYFSDSTGNTYAVDAANGKPIWKTRVETHPNGRLTGAPQLFDGKLFVPVASNEATAAASPDYKCCTHRGSVVALDAVTGAIIWKSYTVTQEPEAGQKNNIGKQMWGPSGAGVWSAPTIDVKKNLLYVGTGDNSSDPPTKTSDAIIAMDIDSGDIKWVYQGTQNDTFNISCVTKDRTNCPRSEGPDFDFGSSPILVSLASGKRVLLAAQKSGVLHALDPDASGKLLWQAQLGRGGIAGGIMWGPAADQNNIYVALADFKPYKIENEDGTSRWVVDPEKGGGLFAYRIKDGEQIWHVSPVPCIGRSGCSPAQSAAVTLIPGVVFSGSFDGHLRAYSTVDGRVIWKYDTVRSYETTNSIVGNGGAIDGPGPTIVDGMLYVNSGYGRLGGVPGNVLLAFSPD